MKFNYTAKSAIDLPCEKSSGNGHWTWQSEWLPGSTLLLSQCLHELCTFCPLGLHFLISKIPSRRKEEPHLTSWELTFNALCSCYALSRVRLLCNPWTAPHQAALSLEFPRWEYWEGLLCPTAGDLPDSRTKPESLASPALAGGFFTTVPAEEASFIWQKVLIKWIDSFWMIKIYKK